MNGGIAEKVDTKKEKKLLSEVKEKEEKKKGFFHLLDEDQVEVKRLTTEDIEDIVKIMRKCSFDVTDKEVGTIIEYNMSFGCYVNRMLIGVGLGWPASYDAEKKAITGMDYNAIYLEDPAVLLIYEGRGIRRILLKEREKEALARNYSYALVYLSEDVPKGSVMEYIKETGSQLEKLYLSENYEFFRTERGVLSVKRL
ncbi:hypothetical protein H0O02_05340 [Candidatus Micrarchaeota archaeon]|nr:hypothetical protein [Candidatus Micrarchaeota archaeon]